MSPPHHNDRRQCFHKISRVGREFVGAVSMACRRSSRRGGEERGDEREGRGRGRGSDHEDI
eukprot:751837-Hanusia_phi.AAC.1